tara:strand:- start:6107 stop:7024 length:918 start_codon:yes stop_codon:yes gene_type:complete
MRYSGDALGLKDRWRIWRKRKLVFPPDEIHQAGENAELRLEKLCRAAGKKKHWSVYPSVRIPDPEGGRREIDLILVSGTSVLVVEQKHWSGRFEVFEDGEFLQHRNKGGEHSHATVAHRIARKARLLEEIHRNRFPKNEMTFEVLVAMTHPRLEWPKKIPELPAEMANESQLLERIQSTGGNPEDGEFEETMSGFGTWDEIHMHGGLKLKGDLLNLGLGSGVEEWDDTRMGDLRASVDHPRSMLTLFRASSSKIHLVDDSGRNIELKCKDGPKAKMHVVGKTTAEEVDWMMIDSIHASRKPKEWG